MGNLSQSQLLKLSQKLSPQQIQMIKLLELPTLLLEQRIKQEIEENPILEEVEHEPETQEEQKEISVEEYVKEEDNIPSYRYNINNYSKDDKLHQTPITSGISLREYLEEQLGYKTLTNREYTLAMYLINSIDNDGYLHRALDSISDDLAFNMGIDADIEELEQVLKIIHELEPVGVGARTLQECLLLQLNARQNCSEAEKLAKKIVTDHFTEFTKKHLDKLLLKLGCTNEQLKDAIDEIVRLSPRPANLYNNDAQEIVPHITPDFILDYQNGEFSLSLNYSNIPELKVNNQYVKMIREMSESVNEKQGHETMQFVKHKIESAKWFISAIKQRHTTLMQTMQTILDYQTEYFKNGDTSKLKPMILKDVADRTGLDVSTISRVVNSKYVQTHFGILSLKTLFSEAMTTESGDEVSSHEIKEILKQYVDNEDKRHPMTDEALMNELNKKGYQIARRTVAKYREMLGIPVARLRKEIV